MRCLYRFGPAVINHSLNGVRIRASYTVKDGPGDMFIGDVEIAILELEDDTFWIAANNDEDDARFSTEGPFSREVAGVYAKLVVR